MTGKRKGVKVRCKICDEDFLLNVSETVIHAANLATVTCPYCKKEFQMPAIDLLVKPTTEDLD